MVQRTLDFVTRNPDTELRVVREIAETEGSTQAIPSIATVGWSRLLDAT